MRRLVLPVLVVALFVPATPSAGAPGIRSVDFSVVSSVDGVVLEARYHRPSTKGPYPVVLAPHGGGGTRDSDTGRAQRYARDGFVGVTWSARGHGNSGGFFDFFGPLTVQDTKDVLSWVLAHRRETGADPKRVGVIGYSQGGGTTNMAAALDSRIDVIAPGHTFSGLRESLEPHGCVKTSIAAAIFALAYQRSGARTDPDLVARWAAYLSTGAGRDQVYRDWETRAPRAYVRKITQPSMWVQAFDDPLFPVDQAVLMDQLESNPVNRLWLSWGGHFAEPSSEEEVEAREDDWHRWLQRWLQGRKNGVDTGPRVTWWYKAADETLVRRRSATWPPAGIERRSVPLAEGSLSQSGGSQGVADDPFVGYAAHTASVGEVVPMLPNHGPADTLVTATEPLRAGVIYAGAGRAMVQWTSTAPDSQVNVKVWDVAPDGSARLLSRGCRKVGPAAGPTPVTVELSHTAIEVPAGHRVEVWVQPADTPSFMPPATPGVNEVLAGSRIELPMLAGERP